MKTIINIILFVSFLFAGNLVDAPLNSKLNVRYGGTGLTNDSLKNKNGKFLRITVDTTFTITDSLKLLRLDTLKSKIISIGNDTPSIWIPKYSTLSIASDSGAVIKLGKKSNDYLSTLYTNAANTEFRTITATPLLLGTNNTARLNVAANGDIEMLLGNYFYFKQTLGVETDGDWRIYTTATYMIRQLRVLGVWTTKDSI